MDIITLILIALAIVTPIGGFILHMYALIEKLQKRSTYKNLIDGALTFYCIGFVSAAILVSVYYLPWKELLVK